MNQLANKICDDAVQHLNSVTHLGTPVSCYFCQSKFTTATGLWHHLETSSCPKAPLFDRDTAYRLVHSWDPNHIITSKRLKWQGSTRHKANLSAWDGEHYACCFCYRKFNTLEALDQHLQSPKRTYYITCLSGSPTSISFLPTHLHIMHM